MARPSNTVQRRSEIVQALLSVMAEQGYAKATIQAIAKQAGLKSGLIHYHFKTKQEILVELILQVSDLGKLRYEALLQGAVTSQDRLRAFIDSRLAKGDGENPEAVAAWVVIGTESIRQPEVRFEYEKVIGAQKAILVSILSEMAGNDRSQSEIENIASIALAAIEGAFQLSVAAKNIMPSGYAAEGLVNLLLAYLSEG